MSSINAHLRQQYTAFENEYRDYLAKYDAYRLECIEAHHPDPGPPARPTFSSFDDYYNQNVVVSDNGVLGPPPPTASSFSDQEYPESERGRDFTGEFYYNRDGVIFNDNKNGINEGDKYDDYPRYRDTDSDMMPRCYMNSPLSHSPPSEERHSHHHYHRSSWYESWQARETSRQREHRRHSDNLRRESPSLSPSNSSKDDQDNNNKKNSRDYHNSYYNKYRENNNDDDEDDYDDSHDDEVMRDRKRRRKYENHRSSSDNEDDFTHREGNSTYGGRQVIHGGVIGSRSSEYYYSQQSRRRRRTGEVSDIDERQQQQLPQNKEGNENGKSDISNHVLIVPTPPMYLKSLADTLVYFISIGGMHVETDVQKREKDNSFFDFLRVKPTTSDIKRVNEMIQRQCQKVGTEDELSENFFDDGIDRYQYFCYENNNNNNKALVQSNINAGEETEVVKHARQQQHEQQEEIYSSSLDAIVTNLYYRWKVYSVMQGDSYYHWRTKPFMVTAGVKLKTNKDCNASSYLWVPPPLPKVETQAVISIPWRREVFSLSSFFVDGDFKSLSASIAIDLSTLLHSVIDINVIDKSVTRQYNIVHDTLSRAVSSGTVINDTFDNFPEGQNDNNNNTISKKTPCFAPYCPFYKDSASQFNLCSVPLSFKGAEETTLTTCAPPCGSAGWLSGYLTERSQGTSFFSPLQLKDAVTLRLMTNTWSLVLKACSEEAAKRMTRYKKWEKEEIAHEMRLHGGQYQEEERSVASLSVTTKKISSFHQEEEKGKQQCDNEGVNKYEKNKIITKRQISTRAALFTDMMKGEGLQGKSGAVGEKGKNDLSQRIIDYFCFLNATDQIIQCDVRTKDSINIITTKLVADANMNRFIQVILHQALLSRHHISDIMTFAIDSCAGAYHVFFLLLDEVIRLAHLPWPLFVELVGKTSKNDNDNNQKKENNEKNDIKKGSCSSSIITATTTTMNSKVMRVCLKYKIISVHTYGLLSIVFVINDILMNIARGGGGISGNSCDAPNRTSNKPNPLFTLNPKVSQVSQDINISGKLKAPEFNDVKPTIAMFRKVPVFIPNNNNNVFDMNEKSSSAHYNPAYSNLEKKKNNSIKIIKNNASNINTLENCSELAIHQNAVCTSHLTKAAEFTMPFIIEALLYYVNSVAIMTSNLWNQRGGMKNATVGSSVDGIGGNLKRRREELGGDFETSIKYSNQVPLMSLAVEGDMLGEKDDDLLENATPVVQYIVKKVNEDGAPEEVKVKVRVGVPQLNTAVASSLLLEVKKKDGLTCDSCESESLEPVLAASASASVLLLLQWLKTLIAVWVKAGAISARRGAFLLDRYKDSKKAIQAYSYLLFMTQLSSEVKNNVHVVLRIRPPSVLCEEDGTHIVSEVVTFKDSKEVHIYPDLRSAKESYSLYQRADKKNFDNNPCVAQNKVKRFTYDFVYDHESSQSEIFEHVGLPAVTTSMLGYNATILSYGQTGSGKTYTMMGPDGGDPKLLANPNMQSVLGIVPRFLTSLFEALCLKINQTPTIEYLMGFDSPSSLSGLDYDSSRLGNSTPINNNTTPVASTFDFTSIKFKVTVAVVELYNEILRDLCPEEFNQNIGNNSLGGNNSVMTLPPSVSALDDNSFSGSERRNRPQSTIRTPVRASSVTPVRPLSRSASCMWGDKVESGLKIREDSGPNGKGVYIEGLCHRQINTMEEAMDIIKIAATKRKTASTGMNEWSSRSHTIVNLHITQTFYGTQMTRLDSEIFLVDLAGSERVDKTGSVGERLKEAQNINLSLTLLGNVICRLSDGKSTHIPYRDAKLTRLLQSSLGGNALTTLIACCNPDRVHLFETVSSLQFAQRAKRIKNCLVKNIINNGEMSASAVETIAHLQQQIVTLERMLAETGMNVTDYRPLSLMSPMWQPDLGGQDGIFDASVNSKNFFLTSNSSLNRSNFKGEGRQIKENDATGSLFWIPVVWLNRFSESLNLLCSLFLVVNLCLAFIVECLDLQVNDSRPGASTHDSVSLSLLSLHIIRFSWVCSIFISVALVCIKESKWIANRDGWERKMILVGIPLLTYLTTPLSYFLTALVVYVILCHARVVEYLSTVNPTTNINTHHNRNENNSKVASSSVNNGDKNTRNSRNGSRSKNSSPMSRNKKKENIEKKTNPIINKSLRSSSENRNIESWFMKNVPNENTDDTVNSPVDYSLLMMSRDEERSSLSRNTAGRERSSSMKLNTTLTSTIVDDYSLNAEVTRT